MEAPKKCLFVSIIWVHISVYPPPTPLYVSSLKTDPLSIVLLRFHNQLNSYRLELETHGRITATFVNKIGALNALVTTVFEGFKKQVMFDLVCRRGVYYWNALTLLLVFVQIFSGELCS